MRSRVLWVGGRSLSLGPLVGDVLGFKYTNGMPAKACRVEEGAARGRASIGRARRLDMVVDCSKMSHENTVGQSHRGPEWL